VSLPRVRRAFSDQITNRRMVLAHSLAGAPAFRGVGLLRYDFFTVTFTHLATLVSKAVPALHS